MNLRSERKFMRNFDLLEKKSEKKMEDDEKPCFKTEKILHKTCVVTTIEEQRRATLAYFNEKKLMEIWSKRSEDYIPTNPSKSAKKKAVRKQKVPEEKISRKNPSREEFVNGGKSARAAEEEKIEFEASCVNLLNLSEQDSELLHTDDENFSLDEQRRLAVLFVAALNNCVLTDHGEKNIIVKNTKIGEVETSKQDKSEIVLTASAARENFAKSLSSLDASIEGLEITKGLSKTSVYLSLPTRLDVSPDPFRLADHNDFSTFFGGCKSRKKHTKKKPLPFFTTGSFPILHSLAWKFGMHPAFVNPKSPMRMRPEVLAECAAPLARQDPRTLDFVESERVKQVNATLSLDDPSNTMGFLNHLEWLSYIAQKGYIDFILVLRYGQSNISVCDKDYANEMDQDIALHAGIHAETILIISSQRMAASAQEFAKTMQKRMAERSKNLCDRLHKILHTGLREQLDVGGVHGSYTVMACKKSEEIYQNFVDVSMREQFPGLFDQFSRRTLKDDKWAEFAIPADQKPEVQYSNRSRCYERLIEYLNDVLGNLGADYYFSVASRQTTTPESWSNLDSLKHRTAMTKAERESWKNAIKTLDSSIPIQNSTIFGEKVKALIVTNDGPLKRDLYGMKNESECSSMKHLLFYGPDEASFQPFFGRRLGSTDFIPLEIGYLNAFGRLFSTVPPLDLRQTEKLAFSILWSPAFRDYLLPNRTDLRNILLGHPSLDDSLRMGFQKEKKKNDSQAASSSQ